MADKLDKRPSADGQGDAAHPPPNGAALAQPLQMLRSCWWLLRTITSPSMETLAPADLGLISTLSNISSIPLSIVSSQSQVSHGQPWQTCVSAALSTTGPRLSCLLVCHPLHDPTMHAALVASSSPACSKLQKLQKLLYTVLSLPLPGSRQLPDLSHRPTICSAGTLVVAPRAPCWGPCD